MARSFLGKGWKFPIRVDSATGKIMTSEYEEDVAEAIRIIIFTIKGERVMRPNFGCNAYNFVFGSMDATTLGLLESEIKEAITVWEPRVVNVEVKAVPDREASGRLMINIKYTVRTTNNLFNLVYPFYLTEGTK